MSKIKPMIPFPHVHLNKLEISLLMDIHLMLMVRNYSCNIS